MELLEERLAKLWMTGFRKSVPPGGSPRAAWAHPQDMVQVLLTEFPPPNTDFESRNLQYLIRVCWIHDILEDGHKPDGSLVTEEDLLACSVENCIVRDVVSISKKQGEPKDKYLARLISTSLRVRLVKCIDRACNLRDAPRTKSPEWWDLYAAETRKYILPLTVGLDYEDWATYLLQHALTLRPSRRIHQVTLPSL